MNIRKICPYCGRTYTPYKRKQKECGRQGCQRARQEDTRLERLAVTSERVAYLSEWHRHIWRSRKLNMQLRNAQDTAA